MFSTRRKSASSPQFLKRFVASLPMLAMAYGTSSVAEPVPVTENGLPPTTIPTYPEVGAPSFSYPTGTTLFGSDGTNQASNGGDNSGSSSGPITVNYNACTGCDPLTTMLAQPWGQNAADAANTVGITPEALASTCVMESGCKNANGVGTVSGAFQMTDGTYQQMAQEVTADNPGLNIDTSLAGKSDPANQAYMAGQYLYDAATYLKNNGINNPTILDTRGYYQFGPGPAAELANANDSQNLEHIVGLGPQAMANNGITATTTVGDWRQKIVNKLGATATQTVLQ